ncbi:MAG: hypothetical protein V8Q79_10870 [Christensenellales bacterium]
MKNIKQHARVQIERIFRKNEPTQGTFDRMLAVRGANSAHEALKQLAFAKEKIGFQGTARHDSNSSAPVRV